MFRTRDFVLIFVTIVFLLVSIGATYFSSINRNNYTDNTLVFVDAEDREYSVETYVPEVLSRSGKLSDMRKKIADSRIEYISATVVGQEEEIIVDVNDGVEESLYTLNKCANYSLYSGVWETQNINFRVSEGVRLIYIENIVETKDNMASSTEVSTTYSSNQEVLLELPAFPAGSGSNCIASDVIGIAQDGSLIRNNETGVYGVFGENTLVGYALDGYPIYGSTSRDLDECGGANIGNGYGYYISDQSENILNCFMANPVSI